MKNKKNTRNWKKKISEMKKKLKVAYLKSISKQNNSQGDEGNSS